MSLIDKMMAMSYAERLPVPVDYMSGEIVGWFFTFWAGAFGLAVIPWGIYRLYKRGDDIVLLMCIGGLICSLAEPMLDHIGHLWYPTNLPGPAFIGFDLHIPALIPPCYVFFIAMTGYWAYLKMKEGITTVNGVYLVWALIASTDIIMEIPGTALGAYTYYGDAPFKYLGFPLAWGWLNGTAMLLTGFLLYLVEPHLKGKDRLWLIMVTPVAFGASYGIVAWPYFMALNWDMPWIATRLLTLLSLGMCLMVVRFVAAVVVKNSESPIESLVARPSAA